MSRDSRPITIGSVWKSKKHGEFEVVDYKGYNNIKVRFTKTGFQTVTKGCQVRTGHVKDKLSPSVFGVGFIGDGKFSAKDNDRQTDAYKAWKTIFKVCYSSKLTNKVNPYVNCTVCDEWHNFQNFAKWYDENYPKDGGKYTIDKNIKSLGSKVYCPEHCIFVTSSIYRFAIRIEKTKGQLPVGVSIESRNGRFQSFSKDPYTDKNARLGYFDSAIEAHLAWRNKKYEYAIELANQQEREEVKIALLNWAQALKEFRIHPIDD